MEKIKNLAEFKRKMIKDSMWLFYDSRLPHIKTTLRRCTISQSNSFALNNHPNMKDKTKSSWLDYPKAKDILFIQEEGMSTKVRVNVGQHYLTYVPF